MVDLFLVIGVFCNSISIVLLQIQIRRLRREKENKLFVDDLKAADRLQVFCKSMDSVGSFGEYVSRVYGEPNLH